MKKKTRKKPTIKKKSKIKKCKKNNKNKLLTKEQREDLENKKQEKHLSALVKDASKLGLELDFSTEGLKREFEEVKSLMDRGELTRKEAAWRVSLICSFRIEANLHGTDFHALETLMELSDTGEAVFGQDLFDKLTISEEAARSHKTALRRYKQEHKV